MVGGLSACVSHWLLKCDAGLLTAALIVAKLVSPIESIRSVLGDDLGDYSSAHIDDFHRSNSSGLGLHFLHENPSLPRQEELLIALCLVGALTIALIIRLSCCQPVEDATAAGSAEDKIRELTRKKGEIEKQLQEIEKAREEKQITLGPNNPDETVVNESPEENKQLSQEELRAIAKEAETKTVFVSFPVWKCQNCRS
jgi:type II secretory pathway component PulM